MSDIWHTAVHEAGHAWAGRQKGINVSLITIVPNETAHGRCGYEQFEMRQFGAVVALAGIAACVEIFGTDLDTEMNNGGGEDTMRAVRLTGSTVGYRRDNIGVNFSSRFWAAWREAQAIAATYRTQIAWLAEYLLHHPTMDACAMFCMKQLVTSQLPIENYCIGCGTKLQAAPITMEVGVPA